MAEDKEDALLQAVLALSEDVRTIKNTVIKMNQEMIYLREDRSDVKADVRQITRGVNDITEEIRELRHFISKQDELEKRIEAIEARFK